MPAKNDTAAYSALMDDERLRPEVIRMLTNCAVIPCMSGFEMLVDAVILHASGNFDSVGDVYAVVGRVRGHIERIVKRAIVHTANGASARHKAYRSALNGPRLDISDHDDRPRRLRRVGAVRRGCGSCRSRERCR